MSSPHGFSAAFRFFNRGSASAGGAARLRVCGLFSYVDITGERDGKRNRAGKVTRVDKGNLFACEMERWTVGLSR